MSKKYHTIKQASEILGLCHDTLRKYANEGRIKTIKTAGNHRRFDVESYENYETKQSSLICYCRVSSKKQSDDLARQVSYMRSKFPKAEIFKDIGSGLNFKRKMLRTILDRCLRGDKLTIIVAHRDRLCRFGFELIEYLVNQNGGEIMVLDQSKESPESELTSDLLNILAVFSCRMHGLRKYSDRIKKDKNLSHETSENYSQVLD